MSAEPLLLHSPEVTWHVLRCVARCCFKTATWFQHKTGYSLKGVEWLNLEQALQEAPLSLVRQLEGDHIRRAFKKFDISMDDDIEDFIKTVLKRARQMYYNQAVLVLGAAGAGKSSVVNLLRGSNDATTGVLEDGVTIGAQVYHLQSEGNKLLLVDTEGWTPEWRASCCSRLCPRICASKFDEIEDAYRSALTTNGFHADQTPSIVIFVMNGTGGMRLQKFESAKMQQTFQRFDSGRVQTSVIPLVTHADCLPRRHEFNSVRESGGATAKRAFQKGRSCRFRDQSTTKVLPTFMVNAHPDASWCAWGHSAQVCTGIFSTDVGPEESTPMSDGLDMSSDDFSRESSHHGDTVGMKRKKLEARDNIDDVHDVLREINQEVDVQRALPAFQREVRVAIAKDLAHQCKIYCERKQFGCNPWKLFKAAHQAVADGESKTLPDELTAHMEGSPPWQVLEQIPKQRGRGLWAAIAAFCGPLKFFARVLLWALVLLVGLEVGYDHVKKDFMKQTQVLVEQHISSLILQQTSLEHNISSLILQQTTLGNNYTNLKRQVEHNISSAIRNLNKSAANHQNRLSDLEQPLYQKSKSPDNFSCYPSSGQHPIPLSAVPQEAASVWVNIYIRSGRYGADRDYSVDTWTYKGPEGTNKQRMHGHSAKSQWGWDMISQNFEFAVNEKFGRTIYFKTNGVKPTRLYECTISIVGYKLKPAAL